MNLARLRNQRGQAILETVIFLPLFLFALVGVMWTVRAAVQYERTASAVRYAGLITLRNNPFVDFSSNSMYSQLGSTALPGVSCTIPLTAALSDAAPTYTSTQTVTASPSFWSPSRPSAQCLYAGYWGVIAGSGLDNDMLLNTAEPGVFSSVTVPAALSGVIGGLWQTSTSGWFYKPLGINAILACYPGFDKMITSSLNYATDNSVSTSPVALQSAQVLGAANNQTYFTLNPNCH